MDPRLFPPRMFMAHFAGRFEDYAARFNKVVSDALTFGDRFPTEAQMNEYLKSELDQAYVEFVARDRILEIAPGLHIASVESVFIPYQVPDSNEQRVNDQRNGFVKDHIHTTIGLMFLPGPMHGAGQPGSRSGIPLGHFFTGLDKPQVHRQSWDLYYMPQGGLPPTLVARYGSAGPDYQSLNPSLAEIGEGEVHAPFAEAYRRAVKFGLMQQQPLQRNIRILGSGD